MRYFVILFTLFFGGGAVAIWIISFPGSALSSVFVVVVLIGLYLLPSLVAAGRKHKNEGAIVALNLLLGWTLLGWIAALVWALTDNTRA